MRQVLAYHVVARNLTAKQAVAANGKSVTSAEGSPIRISVHGGNVFLNGDSRVVKADVKASNGTIHVINRVILPPDPKL